MEWTRALIIGSSGGIGSALQARLERQGTEVLGLSRSASGLDVTDETSVAEHIGALEGSFDLVIVATGALEINGVAPEKSLGHLSSAAMLDQFALNAVGPALVIKHVAKAIAKDRRAHLAVLSARVGSIGDNRLGGWYSYRSAKAAVNQIVRGASIELARSHKQLCCTALHPGTVETAFTRKYLGRHPAVPAPVAAKNLLAVLAQLGPQDSGSFYDWAGKQVPW